MDTHEDPKHIIKHNLKPLKYFGSNPGSNVFLAFGANDFVVVKETSKKATGQDRAALRQEAKLLAKLKHPHIVLLLKFQDNFLTPWLTLEYMPGGSLAYFIDSRPDTSLAIKIDLAKQISFALSYLNTEARIIHCDIKAHNILLDETRSSIKLCDFGLAESMPPDQNFVISKKYKGTPGYIAPEILLAKSDKKFSPESDRFSLGTTYFYLFYGYSAFEYLFMQCGKNIEKYRTDVMDTCAKGEMPDLSQKRPMQPEPIKKLITSLWSMDPSLRANNAQTKTLLDQALPKDETSDRPHHSNRL